MEYIKKRIKELIWIKNFLTQNKTKNEKLEINKMFINKKVPNLREYHGKKLNGWLKKTFNSNRKIRRKTKRLANIKPLKLSKKQIFDLIIH